MPHTALHRIRDGAGQPRRDTALDALVELSRGTALCLLEARIAREEHIGEIVIARIGNCRDIHTPQEQFRILLGDRLRRLLERVDGTLDIVAEIPCERCDRYDDERRRQSELPLVRLAPPCQTHPPRKLIHRHRTHLPSHRM